MARTAKQWNDAKYMKKLLMGKEDTNWRTEYSPNNHFMYWVDKWSKEARKAQWKELRERREWGGEQSAQDNPDDKEMQEEVERLQHDMKQAKECMAQELAKNWHPPTKNLQHISNGWNMPTSPTISWDPTICIGTSVALGKKGIIAENHFDLSHNAAMPLTS
ncbi:hypothetical protein HJC23_013004 [Cyclotella cryptica]|uniref:Uncharacterized protein n=1 Tax=Cyclotella cryptica TaxID=29204 RepID=A0ABD3QGP0_9STRA